ncbi:uncharacterized mitochondrial protein AtMg00860-like [Aristolochia californica]|uniref:uncharacterized mitochondrial protein AtMg00860-like n=1 Tax=Aristolochia californica TaxID=171875 RepID=UPI0035DD9E53
MSERGVEVDKTKVDLIANLPPATYVKGVHSFLGHAGFYRRFINDFRKISRPLTNLLAQDVVLAFDDACIHAFETLKKCLSTASIMDKMPYVIQYASRTLHDAQLNYTTTEELLSYLLSIKDTKPRLIRWILQLQEYDLEI